MKRKLLSSLKYIIGVGAGAALFYFAFRDKPFPEIISDLKAADLRWLGAAMLVGLLTHILRSLRWQMQLLASGYKTGTLNTISAVFITYFVNLAIPRGGEVARCSVLLRNEKVPISVGMGSVVTERAIDLLMLIIFLTVAFLFESGKIMGYFQSAQTSSPDGGSGGLASWVYIVLAIMLISGIVTWFFRKKIMQTSLWYRVSEFISQLIRSALDVRKVKNPFLFILYTVLIWLGYWVMTYLAMFSLPELASMEIPQLYFALFVFTMGGIGMAMPIPGGIGPYHQAVIFTFIAFNVMGSEAASRDIGQTFALAMHTSQMILMIIGGALSYLQLFVTKPRDSAIRKTEPELAGSSTA